MRRFASSRPLLCATVTFIADATRLLVLRFPVVADSWIVVRDAALVLRIVAPVREIHQNRFLLADDLVPVADAGRDQNLPRPQRADIHRVSRAEGAGIGPEVHQGHLKHSFNYGPQVRLPAMEMQRLDGARIAHGRRNLRALQRELAREAGTQAGHLEEIAAVVRPDGDRLDAHAFDQIRRVWFRDHGADTVFAFGRRDANLGGASFGGAHLPTAAVSPASTPAWRRDPATITRAQQRF